MPVDEGASSLSSRSITSTTAFADALLVVLRDVDDATRLVPDTGRPEEVVTGVACDGRGDGMPLGVEVPLVAEVAADACSSPSLKRCLFERISGVAAFLRERKSDEHSFIRRTFTLTL